MKRKENKNRELEKHAYQIEIALISPLKLKCRHSTMLTHCLRQFDDGFRGCQMMHTSKRAYTHTHLLTKKSTTIECNFSNECREKRRKKRTTTKVAQSVNKRLFMFYDTKHSSKHERI